MPPDTTITSFPTNPISSNSASFSFLGDDLGGSGLAAFDCQLDGGGYSDCTSPQSYTGLAEGSHTVQISAVDAVGNVDPTPSSYTWVVDTVAPDTSITNYPSDPSSLTSAVFDFTGSDSGGTGVTGFEYRGWQRLRSLLQPEILHRIG